MNQPEELLTRELSCAICLQLYHDPVFLPCGHSYCLGCIRSCRKSAPSNSPALCPECRQDYGGLETLVKNFKLCGIVEGYRVAMSGCRLKAGSVEVTCDQCLDSMVPAVKTCLHCETSLCQAHLSRHQDRHRSRGHALVEPLPPLQDLQKCPLHEREVEYLCSRDRAFLCCECISEGNHQDHEVQMLEAAKSDLRRVLEGLSKATSDRLQMTEALLRRARERAKGVESPTEALTAKAGALLDSMTDLINTYKLRMKNLSEAELQACENAWQASVGELTNYQHQLKKVSHAAGDLLSSSPSDFLFIQQFLTLECELRQAARVTVPVLPSPQPTDTKHLRSSMATDAFRSEMTKLLQCLHTHMNPLELTFNAATLHPSLILSTDQQTVKYWGGNKPNLVIGEQGEHFSSTVQVICSQGFTHGAHVWLAELGSNCMWSAGLCYNSIPRKGDHSKLGHNSVSWRLQWKNKKLTACHDSGSTTVGDMPTLPLKRLEVALDYEAGTLSFYSTGAKGKKLHLYTFRTTFREMVYPAFGLHSTGDESWITLLNGS